MSLINKMLRDLDARGASRGDHPGLPAAVMPLAAHQEPQRGVRWWLLGAFVATATGAAVWYGTQDDNRVAPVVPAVVRPAPVTPKAVPKAEPAVAPVAPVPTTDPALPALRLDEDLFAAPTVTAAPPRKAPVVAPKATQRKDAKDTGAATSRAPVVALPTVPLVSLVPPTAPAPAVSADTRIDKHVRLPPPAERAEIVYRRGILAQRQGNAEEAAGNYRAALEEYPEHAAARQTLAALLIEVKRLDDAEELLRKGTELASVRLASTLALARLKVERNQAPVALELLQKNAASGERSAEYQGFAGALLNRAGRTAEAVERYQMATRLAPNEGRWWAGLGIALDAAGKDREAREAYQKARTLPGLPADLALHIDQRLR